MLTTVAWDKDVNLKVLLLKFIYIILTKCDEFIQTSPYIVNNRVQGADSINGCRLTSMGNPIVEIRRS